MPACASVAELSLPRFGRLHQGCNSLIVTSIAKTANPRRIHGATGGLVKVNGSMLKVASRVGCSPSKRLAKHPITKMKGGSKYVLLAHCLAAGVREIIS